MPDPKTLAALRTLVSAWTPPDWRRGGGVVTGIPPVDVALGGGLPPGRLTEMVAGTGTGGQSVLAQIITTARAARQRVALIDASDAFAPEAVAPDDLRHLVWARAHNLREAMTVADVLVRDGNFSCVILDLRDVPVRALNRISKSSWHRLHRIADRQPAAILVASSYPLVPAVRWRLVLPHAWSLGDQRRTRPDLAESLVVETVRGVAAEELAG